MALSVSTTHTQDRIAQETDADINAENDIFGGPCRVHYIEVTNTGGAAGTCYLKLYDARSAVNTDIPIRNIYMRAGETRRIESITGIPFNVGLSVRCAQQADDTGASADPADTVTYKIVVR